MGMGVDGGPPPKLDWLNCLLKVNQLLMWIIDPFQKFPWPPSPQEKNPCPGILAIMQYDMTWWNNKKIIAKYSLAKVKWHCQILFGYYYTQIFIGELLFIPPIETA